MFLVSEEGREINVEALDRRTNARRAVLKTAEVFRVRNEVGFFVRNISAQGLMGVCPVSLSLGQTVYLSFDDVSYLAAEVRWAAGGDFGLRVQNRGVLRAALGHGETGENRKFARQSADFAATLVTSRPVLAARIRNISPRGMQIEMAGQLREGERVLVKIRDREAIMCRVQWTDATLAGLFVDSDVDWLTGLFDN